MNKSLHWVDAVKAICMISVYLLHSEAYYGTGGVSYGFFLQPFYVNAFFFVSGYLMFRKYMPMLTSDGWYSVGLANLFFRLVVPTLVFSSVIFLPKMIYHGEGCSAADYIWRVFGGTSYWFTSCLVVAQIILLSLFLSRFRNVWLYTIAAVILGGVALLLRMQSDSQFPWYYKSGMLACFFMAMGGMLYYYESKVLFFMKKNIFLIIGASILVVALGGDYYLGFALNTVMGCKMNIPGLLISLLSIAVLVSVCLRLPKTKLLEYVGRNSIVFYFFSGVCPALFGTLLKKYCLWSGYGITVACCLLSLLAAYILCFVIMSWLPWLLDVRKLKIVKNHDK